MKKRETLIAELSNELSPVSPAANINLVAITWFLLSATFVISITNLVGPIRSDALSQLATSPRFLMETVLGAGAILWLSLLAFRASIPGALSRQFAAGGFVLIALWLSQYLIGFISPALEPSSLGKRPYCLYETLVYSLPPILISLFIINRLFPLQPIRTAMSVSLAAGMMPALYMQLACMYEPAHILSFHILPGLAMVLAGAGIAMLWWTRR